MVTEPALPSLPLDQELPTLLTQVAPWAGVELSILRARLFRGEEPGVAWGDGYSTYAVLDVRIVAVGMEEVDFRSRDTWDLVLANGQRLTSLDRLGVNLLPGDDVTVSIAYRVEADDTLAGAEIEVNGAQRNVVQPLRIPLDVPRTFESPLSLSDLAGLVLEAGAENGLAFEVLSAIHGVNIPNRNLRAPINQRYVSLALRLSHEWRFDIAYSSDREGPRIAYGGGTYQAPREVNELVERGGDLEVPVDLLVDSSVADFELVFNTGGPELRRIPVHVPSP